MSDIRCVEIVNPIAGVEGQVLFKLKWLFHVKKETVAQGVVPTNLRQKLYASFYCSATREQFSFTCRPHSLSMALAMISFPIEVQSNDKCHTACALVT